VLEFPLTLASDTSPAKLPADAGPTPLDSPAPAGPAVQAGADPRPTPPPAHQP